MKKINILILVVALLTTSLVWAEDKVDSNQKITMKKNADGSYEGSAKTEHVDGAGTNVIESTNKKRTILSNGAIEDDVKTEKIADPKGLMNKTTESKETATLVSPEGRITQQIRAESVDSSGTKRDQSVNTLETRKKDGTIETNIKNKLVTDPKGLMNKTVEESDTLVVQHPNGKISFEDQTK